MKTEKEEELEFHEMECSADPLEGEFALRRGCFGTSHPLRLDPQEIVGVKSGIVLSTAGLFFAEPFLLLGEVGCNGLVANLEHHGLELEDRCRNHTDLADELLFVLSLRVI